MTRIERPDVLAISSSGGHWVELTRLRPALSGRKVIYASPDFGRAGDVPDGCFERVPDANARTPFRLVVCATRVAILVLRLRPRVVLTTGAAPGFFAAVLGRIIGARVLWLDIFAGFERMTLSGRLVAPFAHVRLVQWPHLANTTSPVYRGSLL